MPAFKQDQLDFSAHLRNPIENKAPEGVEDRRLAIYRNLFFNSISSLVAGTFPVLHRLLTEKEWDDLIRHFYQSQHNKTPHFPEISREFVDFLRQQTEEITNQTRPFIYELARYEWLELHVEKHLAVVEFSETGQTEKLLNSKLQINPAASLNAYHYPVHQITEKNQPTEPMPEPIFLLLWRNRANQVKFSQLNPFSALLWEQLKNNNQNTAREILVELSEQYQATDPQQFIAFGEQTLIQWLQQDIISNFNS